MAHNTFADMTEDQAKEIWQQALDGGVELAFEYAEPGYDLTPDQKGIAFANWNGHDDWVKAAELLGFEIEWSDEWTTCGECGKALRTNPNSYGWTRSYWLNEDAGEILCEECTLSAREDYVKWLTKSHRRADTFGLDFTEDGFVKVDQTFENGWHPGQNDDPMVVATSLRKQGIKRYLFQISSVGQFDLDFTVWIDKEQAAKLKSEIKSALPYDQAEEMSKALQGKPSVYHKVEYQLTADEFISGSKIREINAEDARIAKVQEQNEINQLKHRSTYPL